MCVDKNTLSNVAVKAAMRRQVNWLPQSSSISSAIHAMMKYKVNGILTTQEDFSPIGVVSKTDIMGAYYAGIPLETAVESVMSSPPLYCHDDDFLENALEKMRESGVYRLFVTTKGKTNVIGVLAYPDIVGVLYKYCYCCDYNNLRRVEKSSSRLLNYTVVQDIMTREVVSVKETDPIYHAVEVLSAFKFGALLVNDDNGFPKGVVSKTDLVAAYKQSVDPALSVQKIMTWPVKGCSGIDLLEDAIKMMIFHDVHRLFVNNEKHNGIIGVFSLTDAARRRSGSCHACTSSRIQLVA